MCSPMVGLFNLWVEFYMQHEFSDRFDGFDDADVKASAERFEEMLKSKETIFFDEETYEQNKYTYKEEDEGEEE